MAAIQELILYKDFKDGSVLEDMNYIMNHYQESSEDLKPRWYSCMTGLVEIAGNYGLYGNLWQAYLTLLLVNHENAFSTSSEIAGAKEGSTLKEIALYDFTILKELFEFDFAKVEQQIGVSGFVYIENFQNADAGGKVYNRRIRDRICDMSKKLHQTRDASEFLDVMSQFYKEFGVGKLGLHKAFRIRPGEEDVEIVPIRNIAHVSLDDLVGYEIPKKKLLDNTRAFVEGRKANNCLLFGDAGTGKSSSVKAILNQFYDQGLRMIEIYKHEFQYLNQVIAQIKNRNYKFIIYMDDLSFEEFEIEYKYLKAVIEGGLEKKPYNVLIYATSNRRHLVRESFSDKLGRRDEDLHASDTVEEKLSLAARFGVSIFFIAPDKKEYDTIVTRLAEKSGLDIDHDDLIAQANKWELFHGGRSGRTAQQFIDYLLGTSVQE